MKNKDKKISFSLLVVLTLFGAFMPSVSAFGSVIGYLDELYEKENVLVIDGTETVEEQEVLWKEWLTNDDIEELIVLDQALLDEIFNPVDDEIYETSDIQSRIVRRLRINNVTSLSNSTGSAILATTNGVPGQTLSMNFSRSATNSISAQFGASVSAIEAAIGFVASGTTSVSINVNQTVPSRHNNRDVIRMTINARPIFRRSSFRVQTAPLIGGEWRTEGTGIASRAIGVSFSNVWQLR